MTAELEGPSEHLEVDAEPQNPRHERVLTASSFQFRDPEGTAISSFMPVTEAAKKRFASR